MESLQGIFVFFTTSLLMTPGCVLLESEMVGTSITRNHCLPYHHL